MVNQGNGEIDWEQLHELSGNDEEFERELLQIFLQDSLEQVKHLQAAWSASDLDNLRQVAHHIKGASANIGATVISSCAAQIEIAARESRFDAIAPFLEQLNQGVRQLERYLSSW